MTTIKTTFSYGDRRFEVEERYNQEAKVTITSTRGEGTVDFGYATHEEGVEIIQSLAKALGVTAEEIFPPAEPDAHPSGAKIGDKYRLTGPLWDGEGSFPTAGEIVTISDVQNRYPKFNAPKSGGRFDLVPEGWAPEGVSPGTRYLKDWAAVPYVEPKNAREIIEALKVGATFTLTRSDGGVRYFRKEGDTLVREYEEDTFRKEVNAPWDLEGWKGLFTGWEVEMFAEVEPRKVNENREIFDALPIGGKFKITGGWNVTRIKTGTDQFVVQRGTRVEMFDTVFPETTRVRIKTIED